MKLQIHKKIVFNTLFKLETSNKYWVITNNSIYMYTEFHTNQSLYMQLSLQPLTVIVTFKICFFFEIHYKMKAIVCQIFWRLKTIMHENGDVKEAQQTHTWLCTEFWEWTITYQVYHLTW